MTHTFPTRVPPQVDRTLRHSVFYFIAPKAFGAILAIARARGGGTQSHN